LKPVVQRLVNDAEKQQFEKQRIQYERIKFEEEEARKLADKNKEKIT
jgi:hypothetical protein